MKLFPYKEFSIETDLNVSDAKAKLQNLFDVPLKPYIKPRVYNISALFNLMIENISIKNSFFFGEIKGNTFTIYQDARNLAKRPFFEGINDKKLGKEGAYITNGEFSQKSDNKTIIRGEITSTFNTKFMFSTWGAVALFVCLVIALTKNYNYIPIPLGFIFLLSLSYYYFLWHSMRLTERFLTQLFEAK